MIRDFFAKPLTNFYHGDILKHILNAMKELFQSVIHSQRAVGRCKAV